MNLGPIVTIEPDEIQSVLEAYSVAAGQEISPFMESEDSLP
jgi:hypothetical protein